VGSVYWSLVVLATVTVAVVLLLRLGLSLGLSIALVALGLGLYTGSLGVGTLGALAGEGSLVLLSSTLAIAVLAELYRLSGSVKDLGVGLSTALRDPRLGMGLVPAVIGLMPVAGGALLSAPVVEALGSPAGLSGEVMAYINVWFRHLLIYSYPMSQVLVVLSQLSGYPVATIALNTLPISLLMVAVGLPTLARVRGAGVNLGADPREGLKLTTPIVVALATLVALGPVVGNWAVPIGASLAVAVLVAIRRCARDLPRALTSARVLDIVLAVVAVIVLREVVAGSWVSEDLRQVVASLGGAGVALAVLSALVSIATGSIITGLFLTLPILSSLGAVSMGSILLVYTYSFLGYIASPTHLCLLYTVRYFNTELTRVYRYLIPSVAVVLAVATLYYSYL
jgi:integral membrane protein (TIGR00529 family)